MSMSMSQETTPEFLDSARGHIEKVMLDLNPAQSTENHRQYLAGVIDTLCDTKKISEGVRESLYVEYVG